MIAKICFLVECLIYYICRDRNNNISIFDTAAIVFIGEFLLGRSE